MLGSSCAKSKWYFLSASQLLLCIMVASSIRSFSLSRSSIVSGSLKPSMIWSLKLFFVHELEQNLHILNRAIIVRANWSRSGQARPVMYPVLKNCRIFLPPAA